jgi:epoxyqueuosine reductase QueG
VADRIDGQAIFPFDGPPFPPFITWALSAGCVATSRMFLLMHARYGLWHAYRFALALSDPPAESTVRVRTQSACERCLDSPCLYACPAKAISMDGFQQQSCTEYLVKRKESACRKTGCEARRACPAGLEFVYAPDHAKFHMDAFVKSL